MGLIMKIGDKFYSFDANRRRYRRDKDGVPAGPPIYREHFYEVEIVGETTRSWIISLGVQSFKVPKSDPFREKDGEFGARPMIWSRAVMENECWAHEHRHKIIEKLQTLDPGQLRLVAATLGYPELQ